jgi:hypothetical protein
MAVLGDTYLLNALDKLVLVDGKTLEVTDVSSAVMMDDGFVLGGTDSWAVVSLVNGRDFLTVQLYEADMTPRGPVLEVPTTERVYVAGGGDQYMVTWPGYAQRIDEATGAPLDSSPIRLSERHAYTPYTPRAARIGDVWQLAWQELQRVVGARVSATDGQLLDADQPDSDVPGYKVWCTECFTWATPTLEVHAVSDLALITWNGPVQRGWADWVDTLHAFSVDPLTGDRVGGSASGADVQLDPPVAASSLILPGEQGIFVGPWAAQLDVSLDPLSIQLGVHHPLRYAYPDASSPNAAYGGNQFFLAWRFGERVVGTRLNPATGAYLDDPPLVIHEDGSSLPGDPVYPGYPKVLVATGADYLVGWTEGYMLRRRIVRGSGVLEKEAESPLSLIPSDDGETWVNDPVRAAYNGSRVLVSARYTTKGASSTIGRWLTPDGEAAKENPVLLNCSREGHLFSQADNEGGGAFWFVCEDGKLFRIDAVSGAVSTPQTVLSQVPSIQVSGAGALPNGRFYVAFQDSGSRHFVATLSFDDPATWQALIRTAAASWPRFAWDGVSLLMQHDGLRVRRFTAELTSLDLRGSEGGIAAPGTLLATAGNGRSLLIASVLDPERDAYRLSTRFLLNDGQAIPGASGEGGSTAFPPAGDGAGAAGESGASNGGAGSPGLGGAPQGGAPQGGAAGVGGSAATGGSAGSAGVGAGFGGLPAGGGAAGEPGSANAGAPAFAGAANVTAGAGGSSSTPTQDNADAGCACGIAAPTRSAQGLASLGLVLVALSRRRRARNAAHAR